MPPKPRITREMILGGFAGNLFDDLLQVRTYALLN